MKKVVLFLVMHSLIFGPFGYAHEMVTYFEPTYPNHQIEWMVGKPLTSDYQAIVFFHGANDLGLKSLSLAHLNYWSEKGYAVAAVSMPGFGQSTGQRDFCGPFTIDSLHLAIDRIKQELGVAKVGIIAFGQGSLAALLLSMTREDIKCIVCSNGGYDFFRHKVAGDLFFNILEKKEYNVDLDNDGALLFRSPLYRVSEITVPVFLLHRKGNPVISEIEAVDFYEAMKEAGKECRLVIKDRLATDDEQKLSYQEVLKETEFWVDRLMQGK